MPSPQGNGSIKGYLVRPAKASGKLPGVLVVHENRGLNPYIEDVARRLGTANFIAFAPDGLTSVGGYPGDDEKGGAAFGKVDRAKMTEDFVASARWLKARPDCTGKIGVVGFCFGGGIANTLAVRLGSDLAAAVPFYGGQPPAADAAKIKAPLLLHYASLDTRITGGWPAYEAGSESQPRDLHRATFTRAPITASTTIRRRATTRGRQTGLAAHARILQQVSEVGGTLIQQSRRCR